MRVLTEERISMDSPLQDESEVKLGILFTCEKVLFDQVGIPSLISVFRRLTVNEEVARQENAGLPFSWAVYTTWDRAHSEQELNLTQHLQIALPDGTPFVQSETAFALPPGETQARIAVCILGVPVWQSGDITVIASLHGQSSPSYEIRISIVHVPATHSPISAAV